MNPEQHEFERDVLQLLCKQILKSHVFQTRLLGDGDVRAFDNRNTKWRQIAAECERSAKFFFGEPNLSVPIKVIGTRLTAAPNEEEGRWEGEGRHHLIGCNV